MRTITGYPIHSIIFENSYKSVYQAKDIHNNSWVLIKVLKSHPLTPIYKNKLIHEYQIIKNHQNSYGMIKIYELINDQDTFGLILENINGKLLQQIIKEEVIDLRIKLEIAIALASAIGDLHKNNIIHNDINPVNILFNPETKELRIYDFSDATIMNEVIPPLVHNHIFNNYNFAYMSPEQTGRIDRTIDYRTDFYSLGITLYELFSGYLPFDSPHSLEFIHSHIARQPESLHEKNKNIPPVISDIVMKLLCKNPENRYQSARGLKHDLENCYQQMITGREIRYFQIGLTDFVEKFQLPENLFGRDRLQKQLLQQFLAVKEGIKSLVLITGEPGIGKTALINAVQKLLIDKNVLFISGKFDEHDQNIPYSAVIQAFRELVKFLLTKNNEELQQWKEKLITGLGGNIRIMTDFIPELKIIISKQKDFPKLPPLASQKRFYYSFNRFIQIFISCGYRLILFLDDVQWADHASLKLMESMLTDPEINHFIVTMAYRDKEIKEGHLLPIITENIRDKNIKNGHYHLKALDQASITEMLMQVFHKSKNCVLELAGITLLRTEGNPLNIREFLFSLYKKQLIQFDNGWYWKINEIEKLEIKKNFREMINERMTGFNSHLIKILKICACINIRIDGKIISYIMGIKIDNFYAMIAPAIHDIILVKSGDNVRFIHDKIREAFYELLNESEKKHFHLHIGRSLLQLYEKNKFNDGLFIICDQLNLSWDLLNKPEKEMLIQLNFKAGITAKNTNAFDQASHYFKKGIDLLPSDSWETHYELTLSFYNEWAESGFFSFHQDKILIIFNTIIHHTKSLKDCLKIYRLMIIYYQYRIEFKKSFDLGIGLINKLGIKFASLEKMTIFNLIIEMMKTKYYLRKTLIKPASNNICQLIELPQVTDPMIQEVMQIITNLSTSIYVAYPFKLPYFTFKSVNLSFKYGITNTSFIGFIGLSIIYPIIFNNYEFGYQFGELSLKFLDAYENKFYNAFVKFLFGLQVSPWKKPVRESLNYLTTAYEEGLCFGNHLFASYSLNRICMRNIFIQENLPEVKKFYDESEGPFQKLNIEDSKTYFYPPRFVVDYITGDYGTQTTGIPDLYRNELGLNKLTANKHMGALNIYYFFEIFLLFILGDYPSAFTESVKGKKYLNANLNQFENAYFYLLVALSYLQHCNYSGKIKKIQYLVYAGKIQKKIKCWFDMCPANFSSMYYLISAEIARVQKKYIQAERLYDQAIQEARANHFILLESLSHELAALFYEKIGIQKEFKSYIMGAYTCYQNWGANVKVKKMIEQYPELFNRFSTKKINETDPIKESAYQHKDEEFFYPGIILNEKINLNSILNAGYALASEVDFSSLLKKLIKIVIEHAGAQCFILLIKNRNRLYIEAEYSIESDSPEILQAIPLEKKENISKSIVNYVSRTRQTLLVNQSPIHSFLLADHYFDQYTPGSILCMPIPYQTDLLGILYLENKINGNAFTNNDEAVLKIITAQAAISIRNTYLFQDMRKKEKVLKQNKQKEHFFIHLSHDFKTPLTLINNYLENHIKEKGTSSEIGIIKQNLSKLQRNIFNYLDLEKLHRKQEYYNHRQIINVTNALTIKSSMFREIAQKKNITLTDQLSENVFTRIDPFAFDRIINNLIDNAIKYTPAGGKIDIILNTVNNIELIIRDTGIGISNEQRQKIFKPFYQIKPKIGGTHGMGLGLNIVKKIIDEINGQIFITSQANAGTEFKIVLKKYLPDTKDINEKIEYSIPINPLIEISPANETIDKQKKNIFIVDDNKVMLTFLRQNLIHSYNVFSAADAVTALQKLPSIPSPDLIIADIMMDGMNGYQFRRILLRKSKYKSIPFIFLTARNSEKDKINGLKTGADDYMTKPFDIRELKLKINRLIKRKSGIIKELHYKKLQRLRNKYHQFKITPQEQKIIHLVKKGKENKEIADELYITEYTIKTHLKNIFYKTQVKTRTELSKLFS